MQTIGNKKKAVIHVAKSKTGMSEEEYRDLLASFGVASSSDLAVKDFSSLMRHFEKLGFKSSSFKRPTESKQRLMAKITAIRAELHLPEAYVDAMALKMFQVASYRWLSADQLHRLVAALTYHQRRR